MPGGCGLRRDLKQGLCQWFQATTICQQIFQDTDSRNSLVLWLKYPPVLALSTHVVQLQFLLSFSQCGQLNQYTMKEPVLKAKLYRSRLTYTLQSRVYLRR